MAQVWKLCSPKAALAKRDGQSSSLQTPENLSEVSTMLLSFLAENHHIIKVGIGELLAVSGDIVYCSLECRWGTVKAKGHDLKFEQAKWCDEGGFVLRFWSHWDLPVSTGQIKSGQDCCGTNTFKRPLRRGAWGRY